MEGVRDVGKRKINQERKGSRGYEIRACCEQKEFDYCGQCQDFPCSKINRLIKSQKGRKEYDYRHNIPSNFQIINKQGLEKWLQYQKKKWKCEKCGGVGVFYNFICWDCKKPLNIS
ncbi:MAG: DUF3795 domain-containing protein [Promethearchaeia archaeon]